MIAPLDPGDLPHSDGSLSQSVPVGYMVSMTRIVATPEARKAAPVESPHCHCHQAGRGERPYRDVDVEVPEGVKEFFKRMMRPP